MESLAAVLLGVLVVEVAAVAVAVVWIGERNERRVAAQLADFRRAQELSEHDRKLLQVASAHGLVDAARLDGTLRDAEALYCVQAGDASIPRFMEALCKTASAGGPDVFAAVCSYVDSAREARQSARTDCVQ